MKQTRYGKGPETNKITPNGEVGLIYLQVIFNVKFSFSEHCLKPHFMNRQKSITQT